MNKALKVIGKILLVWLIIHVVILVICFFYQVGAQKKDRTRLESDGFCNLVSAGDYNMNINIYGDGKTRIIAMPGSGDAAFTVDMKLLSEYLGDDISLVTVSRPGYGLCEETDAEITTEYIVESTRTALKNAGIEAPYILMPHSLSGIYGTYWESTYPDEVSGVIFIASINEASPEVTEEDWREPPAVGKFLTRAGVLRVISDITGASKDDSYGEYADDAASLYGVNPTAFSRSCISELSNFNANMKTAWASIKSNSIPKIYISTNYYDPEDARAFVEYRDGEVTEEAVQEVLESDLRQEPEEYRQNRSEYIKKLGNCKEVNLGGSHFIYFQRMEDFAKVVTDFVNKLD